MNALFFFRGYSWRQNAWYRFAVTTPDGPHERYEVARIGLAQDYPHLSQWSGQFVCLTPDDVFLEL